MGIWTETIERKARIIHEQMSSARRLAELNGGNIEAVSDHYLKLLAQLYGEEYSFAQIADSSDLVARFVGPAVAKRDPSVSLVTSVFANLREQIRGIAKSIAGLSDVRTRWPAELDPRLSGIAQGSLVVGINVPPPSNIDQYGQHIIEGVSGHIYESVRSAVRSIADVASYVEEQGVSNRAIAL